MRVAVVIPTYQEAPTSPPRSRAVRTAVPDADVLVVDDSSPDGTAPIVGPGRTTWRSSCDRDVRGSAPPTAPAGRGRSTRGTT